MARKKTWPRVGDIWQWDDPSLKITLACGKKDTHKEAWIYVSPELKRSLQNDGDSIPKIGEITEDNSDSEQDLIRMGFRLMARVK